MLAYVMTTGTTYKGVLQLEATFIDVKNMYHHRDSNPGLWSTVPMLLSLSYEVNLSQKEWGGGGPKLHVLHVYNTIDSVCLRG